MSAPVTVPAPAKLNLCLHVTGRRADGYHTLQSLIAFVGLADRLTAAPAPPGRVTLDIDGPFAPLLDEAVDDNLVLRAARALARASGNDGGAMLHLTKNIPVAAGLGGGSADAAAALIALNRLWNAGADDDRLAEIGLTLGADVPVCLAARASFVSGIGGTVMAVAELPAAGVLLVNSGIKLETRAVFEAFDAAAKATGPVPVLPTGPFHGVLDLAAALAPARNDLTDAARGLAPATGAVIDAIGASVGCRLARMAGSGATAFGLFDDVAAADAARGALNAKNPSWWTWAGSFARRA